MPLKKLFTKSNADEKMSSKEIRSKLAMKVVQAQQHPGSVYDVSECQAPSLPDDTYTFCKILQKTHLNISKNALTSFESGGSLVDLVNLKGIDASYNKIEKLPEAFGKLVKIKILKLSGNKLKSLPDCFQKLINLEELYLDNNKFTKVPTSVCALPHLQVLSLLGNNIKVLPKGMHILQKCLRTLNIDFTKVTDPPSEVTACGFEEIFKYLCKVSNVEFTGLVESNVQEEEEKVKSVVRSDDEKLEEVMIDYMKKKEGFVNTQLAREDEVQNKEKEQFEQFIKLNQNNKQKMLKEVLKEPSDHIDYALKKQLKLKEHIDVEEKFKKMQVEEFEAYIFCSSNKQVMLENLCAQQADLDKEFEGIVAVKEKERLRLLSDLAVAEKETDAAIQELVKTGASQSEEFMKLLQAQETQMKSLLSDIVMGSSELRKNEIAIAMQSALMEAAIGEKQMMSNESKREVWVNTLLEENSLVDTQVGDLMSVKLCSQEKQIAKLLEDEQCQEAAFKLLLLKSDLERSNILRQIGQIEFELKRLSSFELQKKKYGVQYGSSAMLEQRTTLLDILSSLIKKKDNREKELDAWQFKFHKQYESGDFSSDYWLIQYQRLMLLKPAGLVEAEERLDSVVKRIIIDAHCEDLIPLFAKHDVAFSEFLNFTADDFEKIGIGLATYHSIQRALENYLEELKLTKPEPSAPCDESEHVPSAPILEHNAISNVYPSAPPIEKSFLETECVVCMEEACDVLFMPCGHICICMSCCIQINSCPLCRVEISQKTRLMYY